MKSDFEWTKVPAGESWPSEDGIPAGEEWEVYVSIPSGGTFELSLWKDQSAMILSRQSTGPFQIFPSFQYYSIFSDDSTHWGESLLPKGWRLTKEEKVKCTVPMFVRARRIR